LGATGPAGSGIAARLAVAGHDVIAGSRDAARAEAAVKELRDRWGEQLATLHASDNAGACDAEVVVLAVHADSALATAKEHSQRLAGRIVVSMANHLVRNGNEFNAVLPPHGSIAAEMQSLLWESQVVTAFHLVPAAEFLELEHRMHSDVVVLGNDPNAVHTVMSLAADIPDLRAFDGGSLANAVGMETFAAILLTINVRHKGRASLRLAGIGDE